MCSSDLTIYRALDFLLAHGLVHKIESRNAFVACAGTHDGEPTAFLICEGCGAVAELVAGEAVAALAAAAAGQGFAALRTVIEVSGRCRACQGEA